MTHEREAERLTVLHEIKDELTVEQFAVHVDTVVHRWRWNGEGETWVPGSPDLRCGDGWLRLRYPNDSKLANVVWALAESISTLAERDQRIEELERENERMRRRNG